MPLRKPGKFMDIGIVGGGAAGFFAAISAKENYPEASVTIFEKSQKVLSKVKISGGGRCNVTNGCKTIDDLCGAYPRGGRVLKKVFHVFSNLDTIKWFEKRGVPLVVQSDGCVFPASQDSQSIIDCLLRESKKLGVSILRGHSIKAIIPDNSKLNIVFVDDNIKAYQLDKVIVTTGGSPKRNGLQWLEDLGHRIVDPVPSLFTFNLPNEPLTKLMGIVVEDVLVGIQGTKVRSTGPLLITHWGLSGPAILKLSSFGARILSDLSYEFRVQINWVNEPNNTLVINHLNSIIETNPQKLISSIHPFHLPERLWLFLLERSDLNLHRKWSELGRKGINKLAETLTNDIYLIKGKSTFREEFVTCGGVSLQDVDLGTMQSKVCENLYFAGEVLDIDAITGGYNLQAAWSTGYIAGKLKKVIEQ